MKQEENPDQGPGLTPGQALRKEELLADLAQLKGIKDQHLSRKRELQERMAGLREELEDADAAFKQTKQKITAVVWKLNNLL
jgi:chromosome segregation ATPase